MPDLDEFGGVVLEDQPTPDEFGGVPVEDTEPDLSGVKLDPLQQAEMAQGGGPLQTQLTPHPEEVIPGLIGAARLPFDAASAVLGGLQEAGGTMLSDFLNRTGIDPSAMPGRNIVDTGPLPLLTSGPVPSPIALLAPDFTKELEKRAGEIVSGFTEPGQVSTLPAAALKPVQSLYALSAAGALPEQVKNIIKAGNAAEAGSTAADAAANAAMLYLMGRGAVEGKGIEPERITTDEFSEIPVETPSVTPLTPQAPPKAEIQANPEQVEKPTATAPAAEKAVVPKSEKVSEFIKKLDDPTLSNGTEEAYQAGLKAETLEDLNALAQKRFSIETEANKAKARGDINGYVRLVSGILQLPNEAIQAALNIGGAKEGEGTVPTNLGERPLDIATHPEAAEWLRNNWQALKLPEAAIPDELKEPKPVAAPQAEKTYYAAGETGEERGGVKYLSETPELAQQYAEGGKYGRPGAKVQHYTGQLRVFEASKASALERLAILGKKGIAGIEPDGNINFQFFEADPNIADRLSAAGYDGIRISEGAENGTSIAVLKGAKNKLKGAVLTDFLRNQRKLAPVTGESAFINIQPLQDLFDTVSPYVKRAFETVRDIGREAGRIGTFTPYRRAVMNWSAKLQRSFGEAAEIQKTIKKAVPESIRRDGITNWIQADGDGNILRQRLAATRAWRDPQTNKPHPQARRLIAGYQAAINLTPEEIQVANDARRRYGALAGRGQAAGVLNSFKDNYVTQIWNLKQGPNAGQGLGGRTLKERFRFSKASTFPTFFDGEQAGFVPKTKDIANLLPVYRHEMETVIAARELVQEMSQGTASDGRPLVVPRGIGVPVSDPMTGEHEAILIMPKVVKGDTGDYRVIPNQPALNDWRWASTDPDTGKPVLLKSDLAVHPEAYSRLNAVLGKSAIREWYRSQGSHLADIPKALVSGLDRANSITKQTMLGFASPFHQVQEATHAVGHRVNPTFNIPKIDLVRNRAQMDAAQHGLMLLPDRASENQFMEGFKPSGLVSKIPGIGPISNSYSNYLFKQYIPGLKYKTYEAILARNQQVYAGPLKRGAVTLDDVKVLSAEQANSAYGHLNYADLGRNPTLQHLAQLFMLAPDFLESRLRFTGQALTGVTGRRVGREQILALGTLALAQGALTYTAAKLTGGTWDKRHPFEFVLGNRRYTMRSIPEDADALVTDWRRYVHNRLSPIIGKGSLQLLSGVDYRGRKVTTGETLKELAQQPIPISVRGFLGVGKTDLTGLEQLAGAVGLKISRHTTAQDVTEMAKNWMQSSGDPKLLHKFETEEKQDFGESDYKPLRTALESGDLAKAGKAYDALLAEGKKPKIIIETIRPFTVVESGGQFYRHDKPVAGLTRKEQQQFLKSLTPEQRQVYNQSKAERLKDFRNFQDLLRQRSTNY